MRALKKGIALLMTMAMIFTLLPQTAFATEMPNDEISEPVEDNLVTDAIEGYEDMTVGEKKYQDGYKHSYVFTPTEDGWYHILAESDVDTTLWLQKYVYNEGNEQGMSAGEEVYIGLNADGKVIDRVMYLEAGRTYYFDYEAMGEEDGDDFSGMSLAITMYQAEISRIDNLTNPVVVSEEYIDYTGAEVVVVYSDGMEVTTPIRMAAFPGGESAYSTASLATFDWSSTLYWENYNRGTESHPYYFSADLTQISLDGEEGKEYSTLDSGSHTVRLQASVGCMSSEDELPTFKFDFSFDKLKLVVESITVVGLKDTYINGVDTNVEFEGIEVKFEGIEETRFVACNDAEITYYMVYATEEIDEYHTISISDYVDHVGTGQATLYIKYRGETKECTVEINEFPYDTIELVPRVDKYYLGIDFVFNGQNYGDEYLYTSDFGIVFYTDGEEKGRYDNLYDMPYAFNFRGLKVGENYYETVREYGENGGTAGQQTVYAEIATGITATGTINIVDNPYHHIAVKELPTKTTYLYNEAYGLEYYGLQIYAYKDAEETEYDVYGYNEYGEFVGDGIPNAISNFNLWLDGHNSVEFLEVGTHPVNIYFMGLHTTFNIEVVDSLVQSIEVLKEPDTLVYYKYQNTVQRLEGLEIAITDLGGTIYKYRYQNNDMEDGYSAWQDIESNLSFDWNIDWDEVGEYTTTISYMGVTATFDIEIAESPITDVTIDVMPDKTYYYLSETGAIDLTGFEYTITWEDGSTTSGIAGEGADYIPVELDGEYVWVYADWKNKGDNWIPVVGQNGFELNFFGTIVDIPNITIAADPVESIEIITEPTKNVYIGYYNRNVDLYGMELRINYTDGTEKIVTVDKHVDIVAVDDGYGKEITAYLTEYDDGTIQLYVNYINATDYVTYSLNPSTLPSSEITTIDSLESKIEVKLSKDKPYKIYSFTPEEDTTVYMHTFYQENIAIDVYGDEGVCGQIVTSCSYYDYTYGCVDLIAGDTYYFVLSQSCENHDCFATVFLSAQVTDISELTITDFDVISLEKTVYYEWEMPLSRWNTSYRGLVAAVTFSNDWVLNLDFTTMNYSSSWFHLAGFDFNSEFKEVDENENVLISDTNAIVCYVDDVRDEVPVTFSDGSLIESITITNNPFVTNPLYEYQILDWDYTFRDLEFTVRYIDESEEELSTGYEGGSFMTKDGYYIQARLVKVGAGYVLRIEGMGYTKDVTIPVKASPIKGIDILEAPSKMEYGVYEEITSYTMDLYGLSVLLTYSDNTTQTVTVGTHVSSYGIDNAFGKSLKATVETSVNTDTNETIYTLYVEYLDVKEKIGEIDIQPIKDSQTQTIPLNQDMLTIFDENTQFVIYKFVPTKTAEYIFASTQQAGVDPLVTLYNGLSKQMTYSDDIDYENRGFKIEQTLTAGQTYYFVTKLWGWQNGGSYYCSITEKEMPRSESVNITVPSIQPGDNVADIELQGDDNLLWGYSTSGDLDDNGCFKYGESYVLQITLNVFGEMFDKDTQFYINGQLVKTKRLISDREVVLYYTLPRFDCLVELQAVEGYGLDEHWNANPGTTPYGGDYTFKYVLQDPELTGKLIVKANDKVLTPDEEGCYHIENITENIKVVAKFEDQTAINEDQTIIYFHNKSEEIYDYIISAMGDSVSYSPYGDRYFPALDSYENESDQFFFGWYSEIDEQMNGFGWCYSVDSVLTENEYHMYARWEKGTFTTILNNKIVEYKILSIDDNNNIEVLVTDVATNENAMTYSQRIAVQNSGSVLEIPAKIDVADVGIDGVNGCEVVGIADNAFEGQDDLVAVTLPSTIESIGENVFSGCTSLQEVILPSEIEMIPAGTFSGCTSLTRLFIPDTVETIDSTAFQNTNAESLTIVCSAAMAASNIIQNATSAEITVVDVQLDYNYDIKTLNIASGTWSVTASTYVDGEVTDRAIEWIYPDVEYYEFEQNGNTLTVTPVYSEYTWYDYPLQLVAKDVTSGQTTSVEVEMRFADLNEYVDGESLYRVELVGSTTYKYTGSEIKPEVVVKNIFTGETLDPRYYTVEYFNNVACGTIDIYVFGNNGYAGRLDAAATIVKASMADAVVTLNASSFTYAGPDTPVKPTIKSVVIAGRTLIAGTDYTVSYANNANVGTGNIIITGKGNYEGTFEKTFTIGKKSIAGAEVTLSATSYTYDGKAKKPSVNSVLLDETYTLKSGTDYTVSYKNNTNAGTATVTITGTGNYTGSVSKTFTIKKVSLSAAKVTLSATSYTYSGAAKKPSVKSVVLGSTTLKSGTDYTVSYKNNTNAGTATVTITGAGNYSGTVSKTFTIKAASLSEAKVTLSATSYTYSGAAKKPSVKSVVLGTKTLKSGTDYKVTYKNNTNAGTATVTITGIGNYSGTVSKTFTIKKLSLSSAKVTLSATSYTYSGAAKKPSVKSVVLGKTTLKNGTHYKVTYKNNTNAGTATVTITGIGNYSGTVSKTFTIKKLSLSSAKVTLSATSFTYNGKAKKPSVKSVVLGKTTLKNGTHYKVTYKNNTNAGTATVTITGIGNYSGTVSKTFTIKVKTGTTFTYGAYKYKVTGSSTVEFTGLKSTSTTKVVIPATVKYAGKTYNVTSIAKNALKGKTKVTSVTIGSKVTTIGASAFEGCKKLKTITISSKVLKTVGKNAFKGIDSKATIKTPKGKLSSYKKILKNKGQGSKVSIK